MVKDGKTPGKTPNADAQNAEILAGIAPYLQGLVSTSTGNTPTSSTSISTSVTKLTYNTAKALMQEAADAAGYTGKLNSEDIKQFMIDFEKKQNEQIAKVVTITQSKLDPNADATAIKKTIESTARQEFPSFFKPAEFASDYIWSKIDFKNETSLGAKSLDALAKVRGLVDSFQLLGVSDAEAKIAAKQIAMGKKTLEEYTIELQKTAKKEYPQFADRFDLDPTLTTYDIASPIINMLSKTWQVDAKTIKMDNPIVTKWLRFAGPDGKGQQPSYNDLLIEARKDPKYQETTEANENARSAATGLARALGYGV